MSNDGPGWPWLTLMEFLRPDAHGAASKSSTRFRLIEMFIHPPITLPSGDKVNRMLDSLFTMFAIYALGPIPNSVSRNQRLS